MRDCLRVEPGSSCLLRERLPCLKEQSKDVMFAVVLDFMNHDLLELSTSSFWSFVTHPPSISFWISASYTSNCLSVHQLTVVAYPSLEAEVWHKPWCVLPRCPLPASPGGNGLPPAN